MIRTTLRVLAIAFIAYMVMTVEYPIHYYPDGSYGCGGPVQLNVRQEEPWDQLCVGQLQGPGCAALVVEYRVNSNITLICRRAYDY